MSTEALEQAKQFYHRGKTEFERGSYRQSVQELEQASALVERQTRFGGEVQIWLVTAYEAAGQRQDAISLCKQLNRHPDLETREQSRRLLYILEAPQLNRKPEWLTQIPDLSNLEDNASPTFQVKIAPAKPPRARSAFQIDDPIDLTQVKTNDNAFIWLALGAISLILGAVWWLS
jgi:hypothetical protein